MGAVFCRNTRIVKVSRRRALTGFACLALAFGSGAGVCHAQSEIKWPNRPVRLIVPFPAGSASDIVARIIGQKLGSLLGQQFVIDNRSGASGNIGADAVAHAAPDGYTIGLATNSTHGVATALSPRL